MPMCRFTHGLRVLRVLRDPLLAMRRHPRIRGFEALFGVRSKAEDHGLEAHRDPCGQRIRLPQETATQMLCVRENRKPEVYGAY